MQRLHRVLAVYLATGRALSSFWSQKRQAIDEDFYTIAFTIEDRAALHQRIFNRLEAMFAQGLVKEVQNLIKKYPVDGSMPAMRAVAYRQVFEYLQGQMDPETMQKKALYATRQLAKRQLTWLKSWPDIDLALESVEIDAEAVMQKIFCTSGNL